MNREQISWSTLSKNKLRLPIITITLLLLFWSIPGSAQVESGYYVDNGNSISRVYTGDPKEIVVEEWQIRLYKRGSPTGGRDNWGLISGKSTESVLRDLKHGQDFELKWDRFIGKDPDSEVYTYFNPMGPIAVVKRDKPDARERERIEKVVEAVSNIKEHIEAAEEIDKILKEEPSEPNPFAEVGTVFKEYAENLRDAVLRVRKLQALLNESTTRLGNQLDSDLDQITKEMAVSERDLGRMRTSIAQVQSQRKSAGSGDFGSPNSGWLITRDDGRKEWIFFKPDGTATVARLGENGWYNAGVDVTYRWHREGQELIWGKDGSDAQWRESAQANRVVARLSNGGATDSFSVERLDKSPLSQ